MPDGTIWDSKTWLCVIGDNNAQIINFMYNRFGEKFGPGYSDLEIKEMKTRKNGIVYTFNIQNNG